MAASTQPNQSTPTEPASSAPKDEFLAPPPAKSGGGTGAMLGVIILVVIMVVSGAGTFLALNNLGTTTTTHTHVPTIIPCASGTVCSHDASVFSPSRSADALSPVSFTASLAAGLPASTTFYFGDGQSATTTAASATLTHSYPSPGVYYVLADVTDTSGGIHDNLNSLASESIKPSFTQLQSGELATVNGIVTASSSTVLKAGGTVTLLGQVQAPPAHPGWTISTVSFVSLSKDVTLSVTSFSNTTANAQTVATVSSTATSGVDAVVFSTVSTNGVSSAFSNYTFSLAIGGTIQVSHLPTPPNKGTVNAYELIPGGAFSEDPAVDYETVGYEPIVNVFQTLISYNGSLAGPYPNDYVPNLATCVPGSQMCANLYSGNTLVSGTNYTFVINPAAQFYNPHTKASYPVYPVDVLFSFARTCLFTTFPSGNPGWIQCQALLPSYQNTPTNILNAITMNKTGACPATGAPNGCITFTTQFSGQAWPEFLEFIADPLGGSVISCRFAATLGGNLPGLPCSATTNPSGISDTAWKPYQQGMGASGSDYKGTTATPVATWATTLRYDMVGSGPYYSVSSLTPGGTLGIGYTLALNPSWVGTTCSWGGCIPAKFPVTTINMVYESTQYEGETAFQNGKADLATVPATDFSSVLLPMLHSGTASLTSAPGLSIFFSNFNLAFDPVGAQTYLPSGTTLNAPSTLFQDLAFRQFMIHAFPYQTVQSQYNTVDGIPLSQLYNGAIPLGMGNYYPANVSWANQDPNVPSASSTQSPTYWWNQVQGETGPGAIAKTACTTAKPCVFPFLTYAGAPLQDLINGAWVSEISKYSGGAVDMIPKDVSFYTLVVNTFNGPGADPMPIYELGWAPDYPDPTDYVGVMYQADSYYTATDALCEGLGGTCAVSGLNAGSYSASCPANYVWSSSNVTTACQGTAFNLMNSLILQANVDTNLNHRAFLYNEVEHIAQQIGVFIPNPGQGITNWITASWLNGASFNENPTIGGGGDSTWYTVGYNQ